MQNRHFFANNSKTTGRNFLASTGGHSVSMRRIEWCRSRCRHSKLTIRYGWHNSVKFTNFFSYFVGNDDWERSFVSFLCFNRHLKPSNEYNTVITITQEDNFLFHFLPFLLYLKTSKQIMPWQWHTEMQIWKESSITISSKHAKNKKTTFANNKGKKFVTPVM